MYCRCSLYKWLRSQVYHMLQTNALFTTIPGRICDSRPQFVPGFYSYEAHTGNLTPLKHVFTGYSGCSR